MKLRGSPGYYYTAPWSFLFFFFFFPVVLEVLGVSLIKGQEKNATTTLKRTKYSDSQDGQFHEVCIIRIHKDSIDTQWLSIAVLRKPRRHHESMCYRFLTVPIAVNPSHPTPTLNTFESCTYTTTISQASQAWIKRAWWETSSVLRL